MLNQGDVLDLLGNLFEEYVLQNGQPGQEDAFEQHMEFLEVIKDWATSENLKDVLVQVLTDDDEKAAR